MRQAIKLRPLSPPGQSRKRPAVSPDEDFSWLPVRVKNALQVLYEAELYAAALDCDVWQFSADLATLAALGVNDGDLRFLIRAGFVEFAIETTARGETNRTFRHDEDLILDGCTVFVLTPAGKAIVVPPAADSRPPSRGVATASGDQSKSQLVRLARGCVDELEPLPAHPTWDHDRQELRVGTTVVKRFRAAAENQRAVLAAFEEEGWPPRIDDPLPPRDDLEPKRRLHETIKSLNRNQKCALIRFVGDGRGQGVLWRFSEVSSADE